jgi:hypothetical protein
LTAYFLIIVSFLIIGLPFTSIIRSLHQVYDTAIPLITLIVTRVGLAVWWKQSIYPTVAAWAAWGFTYWWILFYLGLWAILCPIVTVIYAVTNLFVRLLGYDVRPFPDGKLGKVGYRIARRLVRLAVKRSILKRNRNKSNSAQEEQGEQVSKRLMYEAGATD